MNEDLRHRVESAVALESGLDPRDLVVSTRDGVVTLRGTVSSLAEKNRAERAAWGVDGVRAVANDLELPSHDAFPRTDPEVACAALLALEHCAIARERIRVSVSDGWVVLSGTVEAKGQKDAAVQAVQSLIGVKGVADDIVLEPVAGTAPAWWSGRASSPRDAALDAPGISVSAQGGKIILTGTVRSSAERRAAERAAWAVPGASEIDDRLVVVP